MNPYDILRNLMGVGDGAGAGLRPAMPRPEFRSPTRQGAGPPQYGFPTKPCPTCGGTGVVPDVQAMMSSMGIGGGMESQG